MNPMKQRIPSDSEGRATSLKRICGQRKEKTRKMSNINLLYAIKTYLDYPLASATTTTVPVATLLKMAE